MIENDEETVTSFDNYVLYVEETTVNNDEFLSYDEFAVEEASTDNEVVTQEEYIEYIEEQNESHEEHVATYDDYTEYFEDYTEYAVTTDDAETLTYNDYVAEETHTDTGYGFLTVTEEDEQSYAEEAHHEEMAAVCNEDQEVLCSFDHNGYTYTVLVDDNGQECTCTDKEDEIWFE